MTTLTFKQQARLDHWLVHDPDRFEKYLRSHPEIESIYEQANQISDNVRATLREALDAPISLATLLWDRTAEKEDTSATAVALDLLGLGFETAKVLFGD